LLEERLATDIFSLPPQQILRGFMAASSPTYQQLPDDKAIWDNLKRAIASSSGFQSWQSEHGHDAQIPALTLEQQVRRYLRETLETLAY